MKKKYDEPELIDKIEISSRTDRQNIRNIIRELLDSESFAVLSTQGDGQPYSSLISFACSDDLKTLAFATPAGTRKLELILKSDRVSILIDNRSAGPESFNTLCAVTLTGRASVIKESEESRKWADALISAHPYLRVFLKAPGTVIILVEAEKYFFVKRFQEVIEWSPDQENAGIFPGGGEF